MSLEESTDYRIKNSFNYTRFIINQRLEYASRLSLTELASLNEKLDTFVSSLDEFLTKSDQHEK